MNESVKIPAEVGGSRLIVAVVREKSTCKVCGEPVLRLSNATEDMWTHARRVAGEPVDHSARPNGGTK